MKRFLLLLICTCCFGAIQAATIDTLKVHSAKMDREINVLVIVPDDSASEPMPALYLLHGYNGKETTWMGIRDMRPIADQYGMVIVCPNGESSWYWDSPLNADSQFETFVSRELPAFMDNKYNTIADREGRAITGLSMGGHGAMWNGVRNRDVFGAAGSMSGGVDIRPFPDSWFMKRQLGELAENQKVWDQHTVINAIDGLKNNELAIIVDCGVGDFFLDVNRNLHTKLVEMGVTHDYIERAGAHTATYWNNSIIYQTHYFDQYFSAKTRERKLREEALSGDIATIDNDILRVQINKRGAEMFSVKGVMSGVEHLWQGDPTLWKYRSPVLFPIVGAVCDDTYQYEGEEYNMTIHGIARDYDFEIVKHSQTEILYRLESCEQMKAKYPCDFVLEIGYKLVGDNIRVSYKVTNPSDETIYFQLGAHPGFNYKNFDPDAELQGYYQFNDKEESDVLTLNVSTKDGFALKSKRSLKLNEKRIPITKSTFDRGAMIFEGEQTKDISLLDAQGEPYVRVRFDSPVVGLWSNANKSYAPFACIEPWYGRSDSAKYKGEFKDKDWMQSLEPKGVFSSGISIWFAR